MNYLMQGGEPKERLEILMGFGRFGDAIKEGLINHYSLGFDVDAAATLAGVKQSNLSVAMAALETKAARAERLKEYDWPDYQTVKLSHINSINKA